ncbi:MAG: hypothetical protein AVW06_02965 [Hadesarchaea archaeon DG-33-1]|nr:MAG: hypothetical protein AVW06_02965 [Hadesarchaea archaeon DG-33-1]
MLVSEIVKIRSGYMKTSPLVRRKLRERNLDKFQHIDQIGCLMIVFGKETIGKYQDTPSKEWLLANGLGGYSSSTIIGVNLSWKMNALLN